MDHLLDLARQQIGWQVDTYNSLDMKAVGLLAFDGALSAVAATLTRSHQPPRMLFFAFTTASAAFCILSLWVRNVDVGPRVARFYAAASGLTQMDAHKQLLAELSTSAVANNLPLARKGLYWVLGAAVLLLGLLFGSLSL